MKKLITSTLMVAIFAGAAFSQAAPATKIGYTNVDYILGMMPESKQIQSELETYKKQLDNQLQGKVKELQDKYQAYQKGSSMMNDVVKADKEKELQNLNEQVEEFQKNAESSMQKKQMALLSPVLDKVQKSIDKVAKANGYRYIFSSDAGIGQPVLLYGPDEDNISDLVLKDLGITPPATTPGK